MNTSTKKYDNDLMDLFADSSDDDNENIKQQQQEQKDLNQSIDDEYLFSVIRDKINSKKQIDSKSMALDGTEIKFNPPFKILPLNTILNEKPIQIDFGPSRIQSIRKAPNRIEFIIEEDDPGEEYTRKIQGRLNELIQRVQNIGIINKEQIQHSLQKINQIRKLLIRNVENYFSNLINELEQINKNSQLKLIQEQLLKDIYRLLQKVSQDVSLNQEKTQQYDETLAKLTSTVKQKEQEFPKYVNAEVKIDKINQLQILLPSIIHLELKEQIFKYLPLSIKSVNNQNKSYLIQPKSKQKIRSGSDIFAYFPDKNSIIHYHVSEQSKFYEIQQDNVIKPIYCTLIYHQEMKYLFLVCQTILINNLEQPTDQTLKFSLEEKQLTKCSPMISIRQQALVIRKKDYIYIWGGIVYCQNQKLFAKSGLKYDIQKDQWKKVTSMKNPRVGGQCCNIGNKIYLFGGMQNKQQYNHCIEIFNIDTECFERDQFLHNSLAYIACIYGFVVPVSCKEIIIFGGNTYKEISFNYLLDTNQGTIEKSEQIVGFSKCQNTTDPIIYNQKILIPHIKTDCLIKSKILQIVEIADHSVSVINQIQF